MLEKIQEEYYKGNYKEVIDSVVNLIHEDFLAKLPYNKQILTYYYLVMSYTLTGQYDEIHKFFQLVKKRYQTNELSYDFLPMYFPEGLSFINQNQAEMSYSLLKEVIDKYNLNIDKLLEHPDDFNNYWPIIIFNLYGVSLKEKGLLNEALDYIKKLESLKFGEKILSKQDFAFIYHSVGLLYRDKGQLSTALEYYKKALEMTNDSTNSFLRAVLLHF